MPRNFRRSCWLPSEGVADYRASERPLGVWFLLVADVLAFDSVGKWGPLVLRGCIPPQLAPVLLHTLMRRSAAPCCTVGIPERALWRPRYRVLSWASFSYALSFALSLSLSLSFHRHVLLYAHNVTFSSLAVAEDRTARISSHTPECTRPSSHPWRCTYNSLQQPPR